MTRDLLASGLVNGSQYAVLGAAFALVFSVTGRFHYAFGVVFTFTAYAVSLLQEQLGGLVLPMLGGLIAAAVVGALCERFVYRPVARGDRGGSLLTVFVSALGLSIIGVNAISLVVGPDSRTLTQWGEQAVSLAGLSLSRLELVATVVAWLLIGGSALLLTHTGLGRTVRAVRGNADLARIVGFRVERVYLWVFAWSSALAGVAAIVTAMRFAITPDMGVRPVLFAFVVAFLGGTQRSPLVVGGAGLAIGLLESLSRVWLSSQWSALVVFAVLFLYLCKPTASAGWLRRLRGPARAASVGSA